MGRFSHEALDPAVPSGATGVFGQGRAKGAAVFGKLEGA